MHFFFFFFCLLYRFKCYFSLLIADKNKCNNNINCQVSAHFNRHFFPFFFRFSLGNRLQASILIINFLSITCCLNFALLLSFCGHFCSKWTEYFHTKICCLLAVYTYNISMSVLTFLCNQLESYMSSWILPSYLN